ncbi:hypothetical protein [Idiomarina abyssalis]|uniref:hypothetical protein n=1 Tax=Idiomarina abyssalis TaxID=86102 RepID=UPI003A8DC5F9
MLRKALITVLLVSVAASAQAEKSTNVIEELNQIKQRLILEHMAGEGKTHLQRSVRKHLDNESALPPKKNSTPYVLSPYSAEKPQIQQFEAQYIAPDRCDNWKSNRHMVECQNHKIRARQEFFSSLE